MGRGSLGLIGATNQGKGRFQKVEEALSPLLDPVHFGSCTQPQSWAQDLCLPPHGVTVAHLRMTSGKPLALSTSDVGYCGSHVQQRQYRV